MVNMYDPECVAGTKPWPEKPPVPNLPLLRKILEKIDAEPDSWVQCAWGLEWNSINGRLVNRRNRPTCGTAFCIAGHAADMTGWTTTGWSAGEASSFWENADGQERQVSIIGREALGLTYIEAELLFNGENNRSRVQYVAESIAERAGEVL